MMFTLTEQNLQQAAAAVEDKLKKGHITVPFRLIGVQQLTVKKPDGTYAKVTISGDTSMTLSAAYVGKRKGLIFVFKPKLDPLASKRGIQFVELPLDKAIDNLEGFAAWFKGFIEEGFSSGALTRTEPKQPEVRAFDPNSTYGTW